MLLHYLCLGLLKTKKNPAFSLGTICTGDFFLVSCKCRRISFNLHTSSVFVCSQVSLNGYFPVEDIFSMIGGLICDVMCVDVADDSEYLI